MEPERQIEKLLRASAKKRREEAGAPKELHPATRRLLQAEVARRTQKPDEGKFFLTLYNLIRPRLVFGLSAVAVCAIGALLLLPLLSRPKSHEAFASKETHDVHLAKAAEPKPALTIAPAKAAEREMVPRGGPAETSNAVAMKALAGADARDSATAANSGTFDVARADGERRKADLPAAPPAIRAGGFGGGGGGSGGGAAGNLNQETPDSSRNELAFNDTRLEPRTGAVSSASTNGLGVEIAKAAPSSGALSAKDAMNRPASGGRIDSLRMETPSATLSAAQTQGESSSSVVYRAVAQASSATGEFPARQQFVNTVNQPQSRTQLSNDSANTSPLLNNFNVSQRGDELQVVDEDGSVYNGFIQPTNMVSTPVVVRRAPTARGGGTVRSAAVETVPVAQNYFFQVVGTNRSLKQNVRFTGNLVASENETGSQGQSNVQYQGQVQRAVQNAASNSSEVPLASYRIDGTAELENNQRFQINAVPSPPSPQ